LRPRVEAKVQALRVILDNAAPRGFATTVNSAMGWRAERRPRELHGVEGMSLDTLIADMELHAAEGRRGALDQIVDALLDGLRASVAVTAGSVIRVFDEGGQLRLRFEP